MVAVLVAAIGAGLVFLYAQSADDGGTAPEATTNVLVVTQKIEAGETASDAANAGKIKVAPVPTSAVLPGATDDGTVFKDKVALTAIFPGEQLLPDKFGDASNINVQPPIALPKGDQLMTITVDDVNHVSSFLQPGSHVAVWFVPLSQPTTDATSGQAAVQFNAARVLLPDLLVLSVGATTTNPDTVDANGAPLVASASTTIGVAVNPCETSLLGGAAFGSNNLQTFFFTLVQGKNKLKTDPTYQTQLPGALTCSTTTSASDTPTSPGTGN